MSNAFNDQVMDLGGKPVSYGTVRDETQQLIDKLEAEGGTDDFLLAALRHPELSAGAMRSYGYAILYFMDQLEQAQEAAAA